MYKLRSVSSLMLSISIMVGGAAPVLSAPFCVEEATITDMQTALGLKSLTSKRLVISYFARIAAFDKNRGKINSVLEINPDALKIAAELDRRALDPRTVRGPLYGIPILLKDNIDTADSLHTSAGTLALANNIAPTDSFVAKKLRKAGAIILGKANMTEYANFQTVGMPSGYSSRGGQVLNPYVLSVDPNGIPIVTPGGSSSGSGAAASANFAAAAIGTETSGSILSPASANGVVGIKPTVGLVSRSGIIPIAASQDIAGPLARTVRDAAIVLGAITGVDPNDPSTNASVGRSFSDYTQFLDPNGLIGARIGVPRDPADPANNVYYGNLNSEQTTIMNNVIAKLKQLGAIIIEKNISTAGQVGGAGTTTPVPVTNIYSSLNGSSANVSTVLVYEFKKGLNDYLAAHPNAGIITLSDQISYNNANPEATLKFAQDILVASDKTIGDLSEPEYTQARQLDIQTAKTNGIDAYMSQNTLDAILFPANFGASIAAKAGYPSVLVPAGYRTTAGSLTTPPYPFGATFTGLAYSEPKLLKYAYAYEQATLVRRAPINAPALLSKCAVPSP
jgi:amidase